jgi:D-galactarolactone cycloisomerase
LEQPFSYSQKWFKHRTALLVKVVTDEGLYGWGEVFCHDAWPALAALIERVYQPLIVGQDPLSREVIWDKLYNWTRDYGQKGLTTAALSGIDIALWDILGKAAGLPVYQLLGGAFRDRVQAYATGMYLTEPAIDDPSVLADEALSYVEQGFKAVKMKVGFGIDRDTVYVHSVREAIGDSADLMIDANHAYDAATAIALGRALEDCDSGWFEEPVVPEDIEGYCRVRRALDIPIAGGEAEFSRYGFRELISRGAVDIVQPDICITGGLSETAKIAVLAQTWHVRCMPHVWGTGVALAAALHLIASLPDQPPSLNPLPKLLEMDRTENPIRENILVEPIQLVEGDALVPQGPGLGIEIDEAVLGSYGQS